ncbi:MAG: [FeFe] hydrogenase, group A [Acidobacteriota bacterium]|jgi:formate dehydrogenase major subunit|nr:[FeFe] hydrogenase, group A [Acidobacteriota bacterium]
MATLDANNRITVTVNDREVQVYAGLTILQALLQENIHVPHLCYDIRVERSNGNCGMCVVEVGPEGREVKSCQTPILPGMVIRTTSHKLDAYRKIRLEQLLSDHNADCVAPCVNTCPANVDIQSYLRQVGNGNFATALKIIKDRNPFPLVCGRVCPHPCEAACRRNLVDEPVAINHVKRFAADWDMAQETPWIPNREEASGKRIAVVGAGPSGLSAAYYSALHGHEVTVFERQPHAGGMMRYGIPEYRLPKETLEKEIDVIRSLGVRIVTGKALGTHVRLEDLQRDFDAVYLAVGSWLATPLQIEGENIDGVRLGIHYLEQVAKGIDAHPGKSVVVVGGGNTAIDCARTAMRRGATKVRLIYRRTHAQMPAEKFEVREALLEGVEMIFLASPVRISLNSAGRKEVHCMKMDLGRQKDQSGRRKPVPIDGSEFIIEADTVIGAIGQSTNVRFLYNDLPVRLNKWGDIDVNPKTFQSSAEKVFAGGDCVTGPATVIQGVAAGRHAAESMHSFLTKGYVHEENTAYSCSRGTLEDLPRWEFEEMPLLIRAPMHYIEGKAERVGGFKEVELGYTEAEAREEAKRCLKCGCGERNNCTLRKEATAHGITYLKPIHERPSLPLVHDHPFIVRDHNKCISCGRCVAACAEIEGPDVLALHYKKGRQLVGTKSGLPLKDTDCVSCGQCVNSCPCGALEFRRAKGKVFRAINDPELTVVGFVAPAVRSVITQTFGVSPEEAAPYMAGLMRAIGFDKIFDFSFAADLTIMEETTEFLARVQQGKGRLPHLTSCCPAWVNFVERRYPGLIPNLSSCKSPQQMMAATVKNHFAQLAGIPREKLFVVSIVPCLAKKVEATRPEFSVDGNPDVDAVLTTTEMLDMIKLMRIDAKAVEPCEFDEPYKRVSSAGVLFGASGGVSEATLRMAVEKLEGTPSAGAMTFEEVRGFEGLKEAVVEAGGAKVRVAVVSGLGNVAPIAERILAGADCGYDLIEVMACPGGCICGAGHPIPEKTGSLDERQNVLVTIDSHSPLRRSQENPDILNLYKDYYGEPNSEVAHRLLHTHYAPFRSGPEKGAHQADNSAFVVHQLEICCCDNCKAKGAEQLFDDVQLRVNALKMNEFLDVKSIRMGDAHEGGDVYVRIDGKRVASEKLANLYGSVREVSPLSEHWSSSRR